MGSSALRIWTWRKYAVVLVQASFLHLTKSKSISSQKRPNSEDECGYTFRPIHIPPALLSPQHLPAAPLHRSPEVKVPALEIPAVEHHLVGAGAAFEAVGVGQGVVLGRQVVGGEGGYGEHVTAGGAN